MDLTKKVALVTGGGRRLGKAISQALALAGANIFVHYGSSRAEAEETASELEEVGVAVACQRADLSNPDEIADLIDGVRKRFGRLDILVNSAASFEKRALLEITAAEWDRVQAVNLRAPLVCMQRAAPLIQQSERSRDAPGLVVNMADLSGRLPWPGYAHHAVSKAGLLHLTAIAARELAPGIRVNAVVPGPVLPPPGASDDDSDWVALWNRLPLGRPGSAHEIGETVAFLARNDFMTGETIRVDGGEYLLGAAHRKP